MTYRRWIAAAALMASAAVLLVVPQSFASEPSGAPSPVAREIAQGSSEQGVEISVDGPTQVALREITLPAGATTGQHCHYGQLIGIVKQGTLTHYAPIYPDGVHTYTAGDAIVEGSGYVHEGRNLGTENVVLWVTYVIPTGEPLAETDLSKCD